MSLKTLALWSLTSLFVCPQTSSAPAQTYRSAINLVQVDAVVVDHSGRPVTDLSRPEFSVYEDGLKMDIAAFEGVDLSTAEDGRLITIVVDDVGLPPRAKAVTNARNIARRIVDGLSPNDSAWVVTTSGRTGLEAAYTNNTQTLVTIIDGIRPALGDHRGTLRVVADLAEQLAAVPHKRKAIVFISTGVVFDYDVMTNPGDVLQRDYFLDAMHKAERANVAIYTFDPDMMQGTLDDDLQRGLRVLSDNTGGIATVNTNDFGAGIERVLDDTRHYYLITYTSAARPDGRTHRIKVTVDRPGVDVHARQTFMLPKTHP
jgi:VWFA-related protein